MRFIYSILFVLITLTACNVSETEAGIEEKPFFDLAGYIDAEVAKLNEEKPTLEKTVTINETEETQTDPELDFERDLAIFRRSDINRTAWKEKYEVEKMEKETTYTATDSSLQTQLLRVTEDPAGTVSRIYVERRMGNFLSDGRQQLTYLPGEGYTVVSKQVSSLVGNVDVDLKVVFRE